MAAVITITKSQQKLNPPKRAISVFFVGCLTQALLILNIKDLTFPL